MSLSAIGLFGMNIKDVAALSGLSKSTVSRYLNGGSISKQSADKIAAVIQQTGFQSNIFASRLKTNRSYLIGVLIDGFDSPSVNRVLSSISSACHDAGYQPFIMIDETGEDNKIANMRALIQQGVDALILGTALLTEGHRDFLSRIKVPTIILGRTYDTLPWCKIDDYSGGRLLGEHVARQHPERLVYLSMGSDDPSAGEERCRGVLSTLSSDTQVRVIEVDHVDNHGYACAAKALEWKPDYIVSASDGFCLGIFSALDAKGLSVPRDIRVASSGNHAFSSLPSISLTSIAYDYEALGRDVALKAIELASGNSIEPECCDYPIELIIRKSSVRPTTTR